MIHWRHEEDRKKKKSSCIDDARSHPAGPGITRDVAASSEQTSPMPMRSKHRGVTQSWKLTPGTDPGPDSDTSLGCDAGSSSWQLTATETASYFPQYRRNLEVVAGKNVTEYEESEKHEERQLRSLVVALANFYKVNGSHDPFDVLPQFRNPRLDALYLSRSCKSQPTVLLISLDAFRHACIRLRYHDGEVATASAITPAYHLELYRLSIDLARHAQQMFR